MVKSKNIYRKSAAKSLKILFYFKINLYLCIMKIQVEETLLRELYLEKKLFPKEIGKIIGLSDTMIRKYLKKFKIETRKIGYHCTKYTINENYFEKIDSEEKSYWLGFLYADGHIRKSEYSFVIGLCQKEKIVISNFLKAINRNSPIYKDRRVIDNKEFIYYKTTFGNEKMYFDLEKLGCFQRKSLTLKFPTEQQVSKEFIHHFIRGYFDR